MGKLRNSVGRRSSEDFRTKKFTKARRRLDSYDDGETKNEKISNELTSDIPSTSKFTDFVAPPPKNCVKNVKNDLLNLGQKRLRMVCFFRIFTN